MRSISSNLKTGNYGRQGVRLMLLVLLAVMFAVSLSGCTDKGPVPTGDTAVPASPEECMTEENMVFYYSEAVVATVGGDGYKEYLIYKYTNSEVILLRNTKDPDKEAKRDYHIVPVSVLDECMKLTKKYKMGKGKWLNGSGIVGKIYEVGFIKDGEYIHVSSERMPDNGMDAFDAVEKVLVEAWKNHV